MNAPPPLSDADLLRQLEQALDAVPSPFEPLDVSALDGFLCGVLLQPQVVPLTRWLPWVIDSEEGRPAPPAYDAQPLQALVSLRQHQLGAAIEQRQWFDPWVFELEDAASPSEAVAPWVAGFGLAVDVFPGLMALDGPALLEPLALLYRHLDPDDLEDADDLLEEIESLEPPADLGEAVEELVRATLLLADVSRPRAAGLASARPRRPGPRAPIRRGPPQRR